MIGVALHYKAGETLGLPNSVLTEYGPVLYNIGQSFLEITLNEHDAMLVYRELLSLRDFADEWYFGTISCFNVMPVDVVRISGTYWKVFGTRISANWDVCDGSLKKFPVTADRYTLRILVELL